MRRFKLNDASKPHHATINAPPHRRGFCAANTQRQAWHLLWNGLTWLRTQGLWLVLLAFLGVVVIVPLLGLFRWDEFDTKLWAHLWAHRLPELLGNTLILLLGVGLGVCAIALPLAWVVAMYEFPLRRLLRWLLMLPLALPAYVMAFTLLGWFDYAGPLQSALRPWFGDVSAYLNLRSDVGVCLVLSLALYPYVYLLAYEGFARLGRRALEVGQSLGYSPAASFWRVVLPSTRPWWMGGMTLALMEVLADFGTVSILNYDTFTTAIYHAWFALFSFKTAVQLASVLTTTVLILVWLELRSRGQRGYQAIGHQQGAHATAPLPVLTLPYVVAVYAGALLVLGLAVILPLWQLLAWVLPDWQRQWLQVAPVVTQSIGIASLAAITVVAAGWGLSYALRYLRLPQSGTGWSNLARTALAVWAKAVTLGYAIPGSILAVAFFTPMIAVDEILRAWGWLDAGAVWLQGSLLALMLAYCARFLSVGYLPVDAAMQRMWRSHEAVAQTLGVTGWSLWRRVHLPMLSKGVLTAALMVFIDVLKEMPMTLMARPYDVNTLATRIFGLVTEGDWQGAAMPALLLVGLGVLPVLILARSKS